MEILSLTSSPSPTVRARALTLLSLVPALALSACALIGIEGDEIDIADDGETHDNAGDSDTEDDGTSDTGDSGDTAPGDEGGDTDLDEGTSDDSEPTDAGESDTGTDEGDTGIDDPCQIVGVLTEADANIVEIVDGPDFIQTECGAPGPESVYLFTAPVSTTYEFSGYDAEFDGVLSVGPPYCDPFAAAECSEFGTPLYLWIDAGEEVYVIVDSAGGTGQAKLSISGA